MNNKIKWLISSLICTYNAEKFFKWTIESVLDQTYKNQEVLIWDDGSTDNTVEIIKEYQKKDNKIKLWTSKDLWKKLWPYWWLNFLINKSKGEFIAIQDHDDIWHPEKLKIQVQFLKYNKEYIWCWTWILMYFWKSKVGYIRDIENKDTKVVMHPSLLFRNKWLRYNQSNMFLGDVFFMKKILCKKSKLKIIPEILTMHYWNENYKNYSDIWFKFSIKNLNRYLEINNMNIYNIKIKTLLYFIYMCLKKYFPYKIQKFMDRNTYKNYKELINNDNCKKIIRLRNKK